MADGLAPACVRESTLSVRPRTGSERNSAELPRLGRFQSIRHDRFSRQFSATRRPHRLDGGMASAPL